MQKPYARRTIRVIVTCGPANHYDVIASLAAVAHDRNHDGREHAAGNKLLPKPHRPLLPRIFATRKSTTTKAPPHRHAVATRKTRHHANLLPTSPVVTPPNHGAQDPATANTRASPHGRLQLDDFDTATTMATTAGIDGSKDDDDNIDDTRSAITMVTNAQLTMSWALARGSKSTNTTTPSWRARLAAARHRDMQDPPRHQPTLTPSPDAVRKICYDANPLPASPAITPPKHSTQDPATLPQCRPRQRGAQKPHGGSTPWVGMWRASPTADDEDDGSKGARSAVAAATQWWRRE
ncbi:hypothetical protein EDB83DRAFT_2318211 [Lactarius deliciosus]|nr:hypothetical protein EDB83DRAFT_2318211 [Lactarius deliciosus]